MLKTRPLNPIGYTLMNGHLSMLSEPLDKIQIEVISMLINP